MDLRSIHYKSIYKITLLTVLSVALLSFSESSRTDNLSAQKPCRRTWQAIKSEKVT